MQRVQPHVLSSRLGRRGDGLPYDLTSEHTSRLCRLPESLEHDSSREDADISGYVSGAELIMPPTTHLASEEICIQVLNVKGYIYRNSNLFLRRDLLLRCFHCLSWLILGSWLAAFALSGQIS